ncbi:hypothetical protein BKA81DRAFT_3035 [Phyllosticta paracitricarpa]
MRSRNSWRALELGQQSPYLCSLNSSSLSIKSRDFTTLARFFFFFFFFFLPCRSSRGEHCHGPFLLPLGEKHQQDLRVFSVATAFQSGTVLHCHGLDRHSEELHTCNLLQITKYVNDPPISMTILWTRLPSLANKDPDSKPLSDFWGPTFWPIAGLLPPTNPIKNHKRSGNGCILFLIRSRRDKCLYKYTETTKRCPKLTFSSTSVEASAVDEALGHRKMTGARCDVRPD